MVLVEDKTGKHGHKGMWLLLSRSKPRKVLYIFGPKKPTPKEFQKQEKRIQYFKHKNYSGYTTVKKHTRRIK